MHTLMLESSCRRDDHGSMKGWQNTALTLVRSTMERAPAASARTTSLSLGAMAMPVMVDAWCVHCRMHWKPAGCCRAWCSAGCLPSRSTQLTSCSSWLNWYTRASPCLWPTTSKPASTSTCKATLLKICHDKDHHQKVCLCKAGVRPLPPPPPPHKRLCKYGKYASQTQGAPCVHGWKVNGHTTRSCMFARLE